MINVAGHTIDESLLTDGVIIDVGCRDFEFTKYFGEFKVFCVDPDPDVFRHIYPNWYSHIHLNLAISDKLDVEKYYRNGESTCLTRFNKGHEHLLFDCNTITMKELYKLTGENVDLLKLDCEGAEYIILGDDFIPIPKQISVEFHRHCFPEIHDSNIKKVMDSVLRYYDLIYAHESGMDNLFIRK